MAISERPFQTGSKHTLSFEKLGPEQFERLCLWLVQDENFERVEHLGEAGGESGRDVVGWKAGRRWVFQCKRVRAFSLSHAKKEIAKLRALPKEQQPDELVFVVSRGVNVGTRDAIRAEWRDGATCHFWCGNELDERVKRHPRLLAEFFEIPPDTSRVGRVIRLPYASLHELFQGREEVLSVLHKKLTEGKAGKVPAIAGKVIHGLGGVGKTRLAIEYAWRYAEEYSAILFVRAGTSGDVQTNLAALTKPEVLNLPEAESTDERVQVAAVLRRLAEQPGWLLILDNIDSKETAAAVDTLIPRLQGGHVLLTGRLARWGAGVEPIPLDLLTDQAAADFLIARTHGQRRLSPGDAAQAIALARELGSLPLALEQGGAYIAERGLTFSGYLEEWRSRHEQVLTWFDPRISKYPASVAVTWQTSVDQLGAPARCLLERLAWLGPEPIPESLLEVPVPDLPEDEIDPDPLATLAELATYSLVTRAADAPTFSVHRLVQDVTRRSLRGDLENTRLAEALRWVNGAFVEDPNDVRTWPALRPLSPHAQTVTSFADAVGMTEPTARLMNDLAQLLQSTNRLGEAEPLMRRALAIGLESFGSEHPMVAIRLNNLAALLQATNRFGEAEQLIRWALAIDEARLGEVHPNVAIRLNNLAQLLKATNRLAEAELLMRRALAIDETRSRSENSEVAIHLTNMAQLLKASERLGMAEPLMRRALSIDEASLGAEHPYVARDLNNLAGLLKSTNRLKEAELLLRRALSIFLEVERKSAFEHPQRQICTTNYRLLLQELGKSDSEIEAEIASLEACLR